MRYSIVIPEREKSRTFCPFEHDGVRNRSKCAACILASWLGLGTVEANGLRDEKRRGD